jgi:FixJ family two-component response regulator
MVLMTVFIVSADAAVRDSLTILVSEAGLCPVSLPALDAWVEAAGSQPRGCLVLDAGVNDLIGPERLARFASVCARIPVIVLTGRGDITTAVHAVRQGAAYVLQKSHRNETLLEYINRALAAQRDGCETC